MRKLFLLLPLTLLLGCTPNTKTGADIVGNEYVVAGDTIAIVDTRSFGRVADQNGREYDARFFRNRKPIN